MPRRSLQERLTEEEWLACEDPNPMGDVLRGKATARKLRLFACACCRQVVWDLLTDERSRAAVAVAERFADGLATTEKLAAAGQLAAQAIAALTYGTKTYHAASAAHATTRIDWSPEVMAHHAAWGAYVSGEQIIVGMARRAKAVRERQKAARAAVRLAKAKEATLLRDVFGNPFRPPPSMDAAWLAWHDGTVRRLAEAVYEERAFDRLPVLADALEEAGCTNEEVLAHCRAPGPHTKGCWVVDALLGKA
jgi:hypothetical protein